MVITRKIDLFYLLKWPWLYLFGLHKSQLPFNWVSPQGLGSSGEDLELVFMGDLLGMGKREISFSPELLDWLGRPDFLFFNLEAQIQKRFHLPLLRQSFSNDLFFKTLRAAIPQTRIVASVANNHFFDFSKIDREDCFKILQEMGIELTGFKNGFSIEISKGLHVHSHTSWVDKWGGASPLEEFKPSKGEQSILYLHAGREFSIDPDVEVRNFEKTLCADVLAMIAHHTHRPSGIEWRGSRFVAWSLGNICTPFGGEQVRWGQVVKLKLKKTESTWNILDASWSFITCEKQQVILKKNYSKLNFQ